MQRMVLHSWTLHAKEGIILACFDFGSKVGILLTKNVLLLSNVLWELAPSRAPSVPSSLSEPSPPASRSSLGPVRQQLYLHGCVTIYPHCTMYPLA